MKKPQQQWIDHLGTWLLLVVAMIQLVGGQFQPQSVGRQPPFQQRRPQQQGQGQQPFQELPFQEQHGPQQQAQPQQPFQSFPQQQNPQSQQPQPQPQQPQQESMPQQTQASNNSICRKMTVNDSSQRLKILTVGLFPQNILLITETLLIYELGRSSLHETITTLYIRATPMPMSAKWPTLYNDPRFQAIKSIVFNSFTVTDATGQYVMFTIKQQGHDGLKGVTYELTRDQVYDGLNYAYDDYIVMLSTDIPMTFYGLQKDDMTGGLLLSTSKFKTQPIYKSNIKIVAPNRPVCKQPINPGQIYVSAISAPDPNCDPVRWPVLKGFVSQGKFYLFGSDYVFSFGQQVYTNPTSMVTVSKQSYDGFINCAGDIPPPESGSSSSTIGIIIAVVLVLLLLLLFLCLCLRKERQKKKEQQAAASSNNRLDKNRKSGTVRPSQTKILPPTAPPSGQQSGQPILSTVSSVLVPPPAGSNIQSLTPSLLVSTGQQSQQHHHQPQSQHRHHRGGLAGGSHHSRISVNLTHRSGMSNNNNNNNNTRNNNNNVQTKLGRFESLNVSVHSKLSQAMITGRSNLSNVTGNGPGTAANNNPTNTSTNVNNSNNNANNESTNSKNSILQSKSKWTLNNGQ